MSAICSLPDNLHGVSVGQFIEDQAGRQAKASYLVDAETGTEVTVGELQAQIHSIAKILHDRGLSAGDSVAYALGNSTESAIWILGIVSAGYRAVAINLVSGMLWRAACHVEYR